MDFQAYLMHLKDYNLYETKKKIDHLKAFQVPKSILGPFAENTSEGEYDNIFRVIFESWTQEIERGINGLRKDLNFSSNRNFSLWCSGFH